MTIDEDILGVLRIHAADVPPAGSLGADDKLVDLGIDSLRLVELIIDLEQRFGIMIPDGEMLAENFSTVGSVSLLVSRIQSGA
ncbi:phosphopantetheine-binding protein [Streptacidiphilus sp. PB12-B1b]|uniref:phosphopantetheine-binding protein n=1 Tax=Streptacidiphilus sp. PB12-B1b TaxID=2705012 RepID=UPI0015FD599F|nr:phosphopantetheine-binding protein [Streptacidiphilus sp. PB12-B1b]QMU78276.1 phosphopantetheine-binding protein [Streptacidiphilus sp. PB12-B1b]